MFMINDMESKFHMEISNSHPVAYALSGPSMSHEIFREMTDYVIKKCKENGLSVMATSSDGQWHKYCIRDDKNNPLTVLQLQKDVWSEIKSKPKSSLLKELRCRYKVHKLDDIEYAKTLNGSVMVYGHKREANLTVFRAPKGHFKSSNGKTADQVGSRAKGDDDADHNQAAENVGTVDDFTGFVSS